MNTLQNDIAFMSKLKLKNIITSDITCFNILPNYGTGRLQITKIIPGLFLVYNDFKVNNRVLSSDTPKTKKTYIKIDYCLSGYYKFELNNELIGIVKKGNSIFYTGVNNFTEVQYSNEVYNSFCIMCYLDDLDSSLSNILGITLDEVWQFYYNLDARKDYLIIDTNLQNLKILNLLGQLQRNGLVNNLGLLKLRALELFLLEVCNYKSYHNAPDRYYQKTTIKKMGLIKDFIEQNITEHYKIEDLAHRFCLSKTKLKECFKHVYGVGPYSYLKNCRMKLAKDLLENSEFNILEIANRVGYTSPSKFGVAFKNTYEVNPLKYRKALSHNRKNSI